MQTMFKCFEFFSPEDTSLATRKIAFKIKAGADNFASQDAAAFLDYLGALMDVPEGALKSSLDQFKWVPVEGDGGLPDEVIDLTSTEAIPYSLIGMLLGNNAGADSAEVLSDDVQRKPEVVLSKNPCNDLWSNPAGQEASDGDSLEETEAPTADTEPGLPTSVIDNLANAVVRSDAQQSAASAIGSDTIGQSEDSSEAAEGLLNENCEKPITASYTAKSQFKQIFHTDKNPQAGNSQTSAAKNSTQSADTQETVEVQRDSNGPSLGLRTRTGNPATVTPEICPKGINAAKNTEVQQTTNGSSFSQAAAQDQPGKSSLTTAKGEGNSVVNSLDRNDTYQSQLQQNTFTNENGNSGQHEHSGSMFRESYQSADAQLNANFKEVAAAPDPENVQSAVQDKALQNDVIRQIVQRMNLRSDHLQSQMSIKLKPEFLGDLQLQISTANQHVSIKMTTESAAVKEMIEANIAVLKAELQQHGLHIDKFDVFVGQESDAWKHRQQQTASRQERRNNSFRTIRSGEDEDENDTQVVSFMRSGSRRLRQKGGGEVDFFA